MTVVGFRRVQTITLAALAASTLAAGCGKKLAPSDEGGVKTTSSKSNGGREVTVTDPRDDVRELVHPAPEPLRRGLDLTSVGIRRAGNRLRVTFRTAGPPRGAITQALRIYDSDLVSFAYIEVRHRQSGPPKAVGAAGPGREKPVPVRVSGRDVVVTAPVTTLSRADKFKWRASSEIRQEVVDETPDTEGQSNFFP